MRNEENKMLAELVVEKLLSLGYTLSTAESCTGGAVASAVTSVAGCSSVFRGSVVAYCNEVKSSVLGVNDATLCAYGAVSEATVREMCAGVKNLLKSDCAVATSGIAGPGGGSPEKPVGTVWTAVAVGNRVETRLLCLPDKGRNGNITNATNEVLSHLLKMLSDSLR